MVVRASAADQRPADPEPCDAERRCNADVPFHLSNKLEYKFLGCISVHYQSRMASNRIVITLSRSHSAGRAKHGGGSWSSLGVVPGDLVDTSGWGTVPCASKTDTLGGEWRWVCLVET